MRSSSLAYSASGFGVLRIAACTSFGIRKTPVTALIGQWPRVAALNSVHNNPGGAYAATPRTGVAPCHASLVWRLFRLLLQEKHRAPDSGLAAGGFCCICSAICSKSRCGEMARRSCLLPRGLLSMAHYLNINTILSSTISNTRQSADHAIAPNNKRRESGGQAQNATMSGGSVCDRLARPSADPGHTALTPPRVRAPA